MTRYPGAAARGARTPTAALSTRDQLIASIASMAPAVRRLFDVRPRAEARAAWGSLTAHQLEALAELKRATLTMGELCERLDISESAGSALCDRLVARGMVVREPDDTDRRVVRVSLSKDARATAERFQTLKRHRVAEVLAALDDEDIAVLERIHRRLLEGEPGPAAGAEATP